MCDRAVIENGGTLESVFCWFKIKGMCYKAVNNDDHALEFVPDC